MRETGHELLWRADDESAGLKMDSCDTEIVLVKEKLPLEVDLLVDSVEKKLLRTSKKRAAGYCNLHSTSG